jgi:hypothetical protein
LGVIEANILCLEIFLLPIQQARGRVISFQRNEKQKSAPKELQAVMQKS